MQSTALVELITATLTDVEGGDAPVPPLVAAFAGVPDPRRRQGRRYPLPFLLCALVLAVLCNCDTLEAVGQWCGAHQGLLAARFPDQRFHTPTGSLYRRLLPRLSAVHVEAALAVWVRGSLVAGADEAVALDGRAVRGAAAAGRAAPHLLSASTHASGETLLQVRVAEKTNEVPVARDVLPALPLAGRVVTADALHTCPATARAILARDADYLLVVKGNQPTRYAACAAYFSDPIARARQATTVDRRRGRTETRTLYVTARLNAHLARYSRFPRIGQVACLLTTTRDRRGSRRDVRFLLTSLTARRADPARLLALARGHWSIASRPATSPATSPSARTAPHSVGPPPCAAATRRRSWPPCATSPSPSSAAPATPPSPPRAALSLITPPAPWTSCSPHPENSQTVSVGQRE